MKMSVEQTEGDLKIARSQLRQRDSRTVDALVHEQWLSTVIKQRCLPRKCVQPQHLSKTEQALLLQPSTKKIPTQWRRITISTIEKIAEPERVSVVDPLWDVIRPSQGFSQTMQYVSAQQYRDMWQQACHKYSTSTPRLEGLTLTAQEFNEETRGLLEQLYCCPVVSTDKDSDRDQEREADTAAARCSNLQVVLCLLESPTAFYLIQPYLEHTVADCVVFSPAMFANSYAKQLFVLYQILHAVLSCHDLGVSCGELSLCDLVLDGKLWVRLKAPDCRRRIAKAGNVTKNHVTNSCGTDRDQKIQDTELKRLTHLWVHRQMSNFDYLMVLNRFAGRRMCDPNHHPVLPWIMDFTQPQGGWRDLTRSKFRLNKGDHQLDLMYESDNILSSIGQGTDTSHAHVPHHITDVLSDITYYVYKARRMPKTVLCTNVRSNWVPEEYPNSMQRIYEWSPDESIPEFFSDPTIFQSLHADLPDLEVPSWCSSPLDFVEKHRAALESDFISQRIHHWIDLTFGYKLSGKDAVKAKNVCFHLVDNHTRPVNHGMVQLFHTPHPLRKCGANSFTWEPPPVLQLGGANGRSTEVEQAKMVMEEDGDSLAESGRFEVVEPDVFYPDTDATALPGDGFYGNQEADKQTDGYVALKSALQVFGETMEKTGSPGTEEPGALEKDKKSGRGRPFFSRTRTETERTKSETRPEESPIRLPEGFNPLAALIQVESELKFMARGAQHVGQVKSSDTSVAGEGEDETTHLLSQDITAVGCLVAELMLGSRLGVLSPQATLQERVNNIKRHVLELPRPIQEAVETILQLDLKEQPSSVVDDLCAGDTTTSAGLPTATLGSLLNPHTSPFPFPPYFPKLHQYLSQHVQQERSTEQVRLVTKWLPDLLPELNHEGLDLLLPYVVSLLESPKSGAEATICIFDIFAQYLGPAMTSRKLLRPLTNLMDHGNVSLSYVKLFHRPFLLQLLVRFGLQTFLGQIVGLIVEATADLRDPLVELHAIGRLSPPEVNDEDVDLGMDALQPSYEEEDQGDPLVFDNIVTETGMSFGNVTSRSCTDTTDNSFSLERYRQNTERVISEGDSQSLNEEGSTFSGDILLDGTSSDVDRDDEETEDSTSERISFVDCGTDEDSLQDFARSVPTTTNLEMAESSLHGAEQGTSKESFPIGSPGGASVHSVSRLVVNNGQGSEDDDDEEEQRSSEAEDPGDETGQSGTDGRDAVYSSMVTSTESGRQDVDLNSSILEEFEEGLTVADVAADSIMWLADRLGPALTGRYLAKNLLKLLNNCYQGPEQQCLVEEEGEQATVSSRTVVGDRHSRLVLKCLTDIVVMYGESVITSQYIPHITFMVSSGRSRLNSKMEAGLIGAMVLLRHVVPFMSDTTIMDNLKMLERDILKPLIMLVSNPCVTFPGSGQARAVVCYKLVDAMVLITLRIGREMAREELNNLLRQFFSCFDLVHGEGNMVEENTATPKASSFSLSDSMEFVEIKMDANTNTYRIGTPIRINSVSPLSSDPRSRSSRVKLNASPVMPNGLYDGEVTSSQKEAGMEDLRIVFTPALAHAAFIPLCRLTGSIHMERVLKNHDLIWKLSSTYETALSTHNLGGQQGPDVLSDNDEETPSSENKTAWFVDMGAKPSSQERSEDLQGFGYNVQMVGNRIELKSDPAPQPAAVVPKPAIQLKHFAEGPPVMDETICPSRVDLPRSDRHLRGNWQAYWDYEIGLGERDNVFHFNQIKLQTFHGHSNSVRSLHIMDMENAFMSASKDKTVKLWSIRNHGDGYSRTGCRWTYTQHRKSVFHVGMVEALRLAASCDSNVHLWDPFVGAMVRVFDCSRNPISVLSCLPPPHTAMIAATAEATLRFIDGRTANFQHEFRVTGGQSMGLIRCLCVSPSGTWVAVGFSSGVVSALDIRTGTIIKMWRAHEGEILQMKPYDNNSFISSSVDHNIVLWRGFDGKATCLFKGHSEPAHALCLYNNQVISATASNKIGIHSALNSKASFTLTKLRSDAFKGMMTAAAVLPLNRLLLLASDSGSIRLLA
ncbi:PREDICTED: LOW QUALITY PROTEIN: WD repeat-containing protein 81-like [Branchiostoma belcheri]|uniref:LOW QUALITY PROTEIN: WD repeat-containing protein 81-like n=1 Tax=Branchiostoma belcheri TaxID=7741 RepID=A0A6P4Z2H4_BRABE|nr:PREDICTED: LOW QUALITY PROTEIN: WD repeat-containing protein 81-like [Branchiostoma belcheri]